MKINQTETQKKTFAHKQLVFVNIISRTSAFAQGGRKVGQHTGHIKPGCA